jgi:hypothetical protein
MFSHPFATSTVHLLAAFVRVAGAARERGLGCGRGTCSLEERVGRPGRRCAGRQWRAEAGAGGKPRSRWETTLAAVRPLDRQPRPPAYSARAVRPLSLSTGYPSPDTYAGRDAPSFPGYPAKAW